jgi:hypothetical protein
VPYGASGIDAGVRDVVALLNHIPGVRTRASCEGAGPQPARHAHAALAYVAFRHPIPLQLQDFLVTRLGSLARIEDDGVYCRWPTHNRSFLGSLESTVRTYLSHAQEACRSVRWPLARLRARVATRVASGHPTELWLCLTCSELVAPPHPESHQPVALLSLPADLHDRWFAEFLAQPKNALDATLIANDGWARLLARTQHGDFGAAFQRRWLRYRAHRIADLTTQHIRNGVETARRHGVPIDFFHDGIHAIFAWQDSPRD